MTEPRAGEGALRLGSLCTGYGGLDLAIERVLRCRPVWLCEYDDAPAKVCEVRFPGVPNLHDLTALDWEQVPPVDVLTAGYPCQPFSHAGRRKGTNDERHLWPYIAECLRVLRPRLAIFENVAGHVSLGLDVVLADLAALGFDAEWVVVRASDVGACHGRARLFILATNADSGRLEIGVQLNGDEAPRAADRGPCWGHVDGHRPKAAADTEDRQQPGEPARHGGDPAVVGTVARAGDRTRAGDLAEGVQELGRGAGMDWGDYASAIQRHELALGRAAPAPVDDAGRLSPRFVEWMMMLPAGWVTDVLTTRTKALKALGNGVVPPQAEYAVRGLLARLDERIAA